MAKLLLLVTTITWALAVRAETQWGGGPCTDNFDCSFGGSCDNGACNCLAYFTGPACDLLNLIPPDNMNSGTCGSEFNGYYSWGGRSLQSEDGKWHLYASFMCDGYTLDQWTTVSSTAHFTSDTVAGEYTFGAEQCDENDVCTPMIRPWSHNTVPVIDDDGNVVVVHIGDGIADEDEWSPCYVRQSGDRGRREIGEKAQSTETDLQYGEKARSTETDPQYGVYASVSDAFDRPFKNYNTSNSEGLNQFFIDYSGGWATYLAGNPAPVKMNNGDWKIFFTGNGDACTLNSDSLDGNCIASVTSKNGVYGPYKYVDGEGDRPLTYPESEDPFVFADTNGNYHMLTVRSKRAKRESCSNTRSDVL